MWSSKHAGSGGLVHRQVNRHSDAANLKLKRQLWIFFSLAFTAFSMFYLSPNYNKCCLAPVGSRSIQGPNPKSFCSRGVCSIMCEADNNVGRCKSTAGFLKLTVVVNSCYYQCLKYSC